MHGVPASFLRVSSIVPEDSKQKVQTFECLVLILLCSLLSIYSIQGARGIDARFLKLSPASAISLIMTKFSQYTPHSTCYSVLVSICRQE
jgi:hypothetical protein